MDRCTACGELDTVADEPVSALIADEYVCGKCRTNPASGRIDRARPLPTRDAGADSGRSSLSLNLGKSGQ